MTYTGDEIAIVGMACRFPGGPDVDSFWRNLIDGVDSIRDFEPDELRAAGISERLLDDPRYVRSAGYLDGLAEFDSGLFGYLPDEAALIDPQHRLFLQTAWWAVEDGGYDLTRYSGTVGVFAGASANRYLPGHVLATGGHGQVHADGRLEPGHTPDYLPARVSYRLGLTGPSVAVQTACSSSLVAVCLAASALQDFRCDLAIAGGVAVTATTRSGYLASERALLSPDGRCRAFDAGAAGSPPGSGVGAVLLKRLTEALDDEDHIHAVLRGWAVNNDGAARAGFLVPGVDGQAAVVAEALAMAGTPAGTIGLVEASSGGSAVGDAIEAEALNTAFGPSARSGFCAIGSVKTNIGNIDAASGIAGLIKAVLAVQKGTIPASLHYVVANPGIDFTSGPFRVCDKTVPWPGSKPRRAGVTSLGMGGTNAHVIVEQPPHSAATPGTGPAALTVSARTLDAVRRAARRLAAHLKVHPGLSLHDVAYTLDTGRQRFAYQATIVVATIAEAVDQLNGEPAVTRVEDALTAGRAVDRTTRAAGGRRVPLPGYPFAEERHWLARPRDG